MVRGDIDGIFCLFVDNLVQLLLIDLPCRHVCKMPAEIVSGRILPEAPPPYIVDYWLTTALFLLFHLRGYLQKKPHNGA